MATDDIGLAFLNKDITTPTMRDVLLNLIREVFATMNCVNIGRIESFDTAEKTARVTIMIQKIIKVDNGKTEPISRPLLIDVPVLIYGGGGGSFQAPIKPGDFCMLMFADRCIDGWWVSGEERPPEQTREHDGSDALAICGLLPRDNNIAWTANDATTMNLGEHFIKLNNDGSVAFSNGANITADGRFVDANGVDSTNHGHIGNLGVITTKALLAPDNGANVAPSGIVTVDSAITKVVIPSGDWQNSTGNEINDHDHASGTLKDSLNGNVTGNTGNTNP